MAYNSDRSFTNYVHTNLAIPIIYSTMNWTIKNIDSKELENLDINHGIDYILQDGYGNEIKVQERFRDDYYKSYNDATLRFRREFNPNPERVISEFYKIKADYLVYGITNGSKFPEKRNTLTNFSKWVILDLKFLRAKFDEKMIKISTPTSRIKCWIENDILYCPENFNPDKSSSFIPFDINLINQLWGNQSIISQKGFF